MRAVDVPASDRRVSLLTDAILHDPHALLPDLTVIETRFDLGPGLRIDLIGSTPDERPVLVLIEAGDEAHALMRTLCILQEVRDRGALLDRLFRPHGLIWAKPPQVVLCLPRFSEAFSRMVFDLLAQLTLTCREYMIVDVDGEERAMVGRREVRAQPTHPQRNGPRRPRASSPTTVVRQHTGVEALPGETRTETTAKHDGDHRASMLFLEAKKKILRIGEDIEEEIEGDEVRFRTGGGVLAILSIDHDALRVRASDDETFNVVRSEEELNTFLNETLRRYLSLAGAPELTFNPGHPLDRHKASA